MGAVGRWFLKEPRETIQAGMAFVWFAVLVQNLLRVGDDEALSDPESPSVASDDSDSNSDSDHVDADGDLLDIQADNEFENGLSDDEKSDDIDALDSLLLSLLDFKAQHTATQAAVDSILQMLSRKGGVVKEEFLARLPKSCIALEKHIERPSFRRIDVCKFECVLFLDELQESDSCPVCNTPRFDANGRPWLVYRHFPLRQRLVRFFKCKVRTVVSSVDSFSGRC